MNLPYVLGLLTPIPVVQFGNTLQTLDLWVRDIEVQLNYVRHLKLFCPVRPSPPVHWSGVERLPSSVEVITLEESISGAIVDEIASCDIIQVPGGQDWRGAAISRKFLAIAREKNIKSVVGISSNRSRAALLNTAQGSLAVKLKGLWTSASIYWAQRHLTFHADGVFIVGEGLRMLVSPKCRNLHVGVASWIRERDLVEAKQRIGRIASFPSKRLCIAAKLERMKGIHVGIDAIHKLTKGSVSNKFHVTILGEGSELISLKKQVRDCGLDRMVNFSGTRGYPDDFFKELRQVGLVLLTNLGDEQPRLVFDAISQGCIPVCPNTPAYRALGLPEEILYEQGNSQKLAWTIEQLQDGKRIEEVLSVLISIGRGFTLEEMHARRANWIRHSILTKDSAING